jgi:RNA polymerase sigma-70 factor (ECF subfamily)
MTPTDHASRISRIETLWSDLHNAHQGEEREALRVRRDLLLRYHGAAYRYLFSLVRQAETADELTQDFALRFLRGDYRNATPERGRFRDFLKTALRNLARAHWARQKREQERGTEPLSDEADVAEPDPEFQQAWTEELLARTWEALERSDQESGTAYAVALGLRREQPQWRSAQLAEALGERLGKSLTEEAVRQLIKRSRDRFAELLLEEVAASLPVDDLDVLEQELIELELLPYCQTALERRRS